MGKRFLILLLFGLFISSQVSAQGVYLRWEAGYGLPASGDEYGVQEVVDTSGVTSTRIFGSNGAGGVVGLTVGYMFNEHLGLQLGGEVLFGARQTRLDQINMGLPTLTQEYSSQFRLTPSVVVNAATGKVDPYCRVGLSLPLVTKTFVETTAEVDDGQGGSMMLEQVAEIDGTFIPGFQGAIGINISVGSKISLFVEAGAISQRSKATSGRYTTWVVDNVDVLSDATIFDSQWNYLDDLTSADNAPTLNNMFSVDQAEDRQQISQNFAAFFLKAGVSFYFGGVSAAD